MFQAILADMPAEMMVHLASGRAGGGAPVTKPAAGAGDDPDVVGAVQDDVGAVGSRFETSPGGAAFGLPPMRRPSPVAAAPAVTPQALQGVGTPLYGRAQPMGGAMPNGLAGQPTSPAFELADTSAAYLDAQDRLKAAGTAPSGFDVNDPASYLDAWNILDQERPTPQGGPAAAPVTATNATAGNPPRSVAAANPLNPIAQAQRGPMGGALAPIDQGGGFQTGVPTLPAGGFQTRPTTQPGRRPLSPFEQAFAQARAAGQAQFMFNGRPYTTQMAGQPAPAPGVRPTPRPPVVANNQPVGRDALNVAPGPMPRPAAPPQSARAPLRLGPAAPPATTLPSNVPPDLANFYRQMLQQYGPEGAIQMIGMMRGGA